MSEIKFMYIEAEDETKEIKELLDKGLIKYFYNENEPDFIYLSKNEEYILDKIKENSIITDDDIKIFKLADKLSMIFDSTEMQIQNIFGNKINLYHGVIEDLISDEEKTYFSKEKQIEIFDFENPYEAIRKHFTQLGREQLKIQIDSLLHEVNGAEFK